jgi:RNA polymerase sigma-70 factor (ECF subfamily)
VIAESVATGEAMVLPHTDENLLETLVLEHSRLAYRIAFSVLRDHAEAEDAAQETFLRVLRYGRKLAAVQDRKAWLARIAWRVAVEHRKKLPDSAGERATQAEETLLATEAEAETALLGKERDAVLLRLIAALPEALRDPLILSTVEELSPAEIAGIFEISEAAVRSRIFRARQILKDRLLGVMGPRK